LGVPDQLRSVLGGNKFGNWDGSSLSFTSISTSSSPIYNDTNGNVSTDPTIDLNFVANVLQLDTMEVEPDNVQIKMLDSQSEVEQLKDCNQLSAREERATEVCLDKLLEVMSVGLPLINRNPTILARHILPPNPAQSTESKVLAQVYWWLYDQTLKIGHDADLTVRVISVYMTLLDKRYNRLARYDDFVTIREPLKYYTIIPDTQILVYMESLYATVGETLIDRSLTAEEKISVLASNMSWSLRLTFKELLEENMQTLKIGHAVDLTVRVYGRGLSINLSSYQLLRQYQWLNHEVISVYMTLLDKRYNRLARYDDFVTICEPLKYYTIIPDTQILVYMESLYATIGETLTDRSLTAEEKISVLASNMSWSLRLTFKELLEENTRISYVTKSKGLMMAFNLSNHLWILVVFCFRTWTCLIYDSLADVIADPTPRLEKICTLLPYALLMHNKDCVPQSQLQRPWIIKYQD
ncbi:hypothetical protein IFM89_038142, partial [Coptis chinensis]